MAAVWRMDGLGWLALYYRKFNPAMVRRVGSEGALVQASIPAMTALVACGSGSALAACVGWASRYLVSGVDRVLGQRLGERSRHEFARQLV